MTTIKKILSGEILKDEFLKQNASFLFFIFGLLFFYIIISSLGDLQAGKIETEKKIVAELREKSIMYESELMKESLESNVLKLVKEKNLDLIEPQKPIMIINVKEQKK
jgi:hypothetical protein